MGQILRISLVRFLYSLIASMAVYISLWHGADVLKDKLSSGFRPGRSSYDFIVVGAGTAGSVVAHRLAQSYNVLLLEAGGEPYVFSHIPGFSFYLLNYPQIDWMHRTVPQRNACLALVNQESGWSQGKGLGGSSNINFMIHSRGHPKDYDNWARITGDSSWSYDGVLPYFRKMEDYHGDYSHSGLHGKDGKMRIELPPERGNADMFVRAGQDLGYEKVDLNGRFTQGFDSIYNFIKNGRRHGAYAAYIKPIRQKRTLTIEKFAQVNKIIIDENNVACGVEYVRHGHLREARATKEVIISAGAIQSPKILMLSGIGPRKHLESHNVEVKADSPEVGKNVQDHISLYLGPFFVDEGHSLIPDRDIKVNQFIEYFSRGTGALTTTGIQAMGFFSTPIAKAEGEEDWPDIQLMYGGYGTYNEYPKHFAHGFHVREDILNEYHRNDLGRDSFVIITSLARPVQRGEILLNSKDPDEKLHIDPKYLQNEKDIRVMVEGVKKAVDLAENTKSFREIRAKFTSQPFPGCEKIQFRSDAYWECFIRQLSITLHHIVGSCAMGPVNSSSVVDSHLKVRGVTNLRVIDASIMPTVPIGNTNSPTVMIGEKGADLVLKHWSKDPPSPSKPVFHRYRPFAFTSSSTTRRSSTLNQNSRDDISPTQGIFNGRPIISSITSAPSPVPASQAGLESLLNIKTLVDKMGTGNVAATLHGLTESSRDNVVSTTNRIDAMEIDWKGTDKDRKTIESMSPNEQVSETTKNLNMMVTLVNNNNQDRNASELFNTTMNSSAESFSTSTQSMFTQSNSLDGKVGTPIPSNTEKSVDYYDEPESSTGIDADVIDEVLASTSPAGLSTESNSLRKSSTDSDNIVSTIAAEEIADYDDITAGFEKSLWSELSSEKLVENSMEDATVPSLPDFLTNGKENKNRTRETNVINLTLNSTKASSEESPTSIETTSVDPTNSISDWKTRINNELENITGTTLVSIVSSEKDQETTISSEGNTTKTTAPSLESEQKLESTLIRPETSRRTEGSSTSKSVLENEAGLVSTTKPDDENSTILDTEDIKIKSELTEGTTETLTGKEYTTVFPEDIIFGQDSQNRQRILVLNLDKPTQEDTRISSGTKTTKGNLEQDSTYNDNGVQPQHGNAVTSKDTKSTKTGSTSSNLFDFTSTTEGATGAESASQKSRPEIPTLLSSSSEKGNESKIPTKAKQLTDSETKSPEEDTTVSTLSIDGDHAAQMIIPITSPMSTFSGDDESVSWSSKGVFREPETTEMSESKPKPQENTPLEILQTEKFEIKPTSPDNREGKSFRITTPQKPLKNGSDLDSATPDLEAVENTTEILKSNWISESELDHRVDTTTSRNFNSSRSRVSMTKTGVIDYVPTESPVEGTVTSHTTDTLIIGKEVAQNQGLLVKVQENKGNVHLHQSTETTSIPEVSITTTASNLDWTNTFNQIENSTIKMKPPGDTKTLNDSNAKPSPKHSQILNSRMETTESGSGDILDPQMTTELSFTQTQSEYTGASTVASKTTDREFVTDGPVIGETEDWISKPSLTTKVDSSRNDSVTDAPKIVNTNQNLVFTKGQINIKPDDSRKLTTDSKDSAVSTLKSITESKPITVEETTSSSTTTSDDSEVNKMGTTLTSSSEQSNVETTTATDTFPFLTVQPLPMKTRPNETNTTTIEMGTQTPLIKLENTVEEDLPETSDNGRQRHDGETTIQPKEILRELSTVKPSIRTANLQNGDPDVTTMSALEIDFGKDKPSGSENESQRLSENADGTNFSIENDSVIHITTKIPESILQNTEDPVISALSKWTSGQNREKESFETTKSTINLGAVQVAKSEYLKTTTEIQELVSDTTDGASVTLPGNLTSGDLPLETTTVQNLTEGVPNVIEKPLIFNDSNKNSNFSQEVNQAKHSNSERLGKADKSFPDSTSKTIQAEADGVTDGNGFDVDDTTEQLATSSSSDTEDKTKNTDLTIEATTTAGIVSNNSPISVTSKSTITETSSRSKSMVRVLASSTVTNKGARVDISKEVVTSDVPSGNTEITNSLISGLEFTTSSRSDTEDMTKNPDLTTEATTSPEFVLNNSPTSVTSKSTITETSSRSKSMVRVLASSTVTNKGARVDISNEVVPSDVPSGNTEFTNSLMSELEFATSSRSSIADITKYPDVPTETTTTTEFVINNSPSPRSFASKPTLIETSSGTETADGAAVTLSSLTSTDLQFETTTGHVTEDLSNVIEKSFILNDSNTNNNFSYEANQVKLSNSERLGGADKTFSVSTSKSIPAEADGVTDGNGFDVNDTTEQFVTSSSSDTEGKTKNPDLTIEATTTAGIVSNNSPSSVTSKSTIIETISGSKSMDRVLASSTVTNKGSRIDNTKEVVTSDVPSENIEFTNSPVSEDSFTPQESDRYNNDLLGSLKVSKAVTTSVISSTALPESETTTTFTPSSENISDDDNTALRKETKLGNEESTTIIGNVIKFENSDGSQEITTEIPTISTKVALEAAQVSQAPRDSITMSLNSQPQHSLENGQTTEHLTETTESTTVKRLESIPSETKNEISSDVENTSDPTKPQPTTLMQEESSTQLPRALDGISAPLSGTELLQQDKPLAPTDASIIEHVSTEGHVTEIVLTTGPFILDDEPDSTTVSPSSVAANLSAGKSGTVTKKLPDAESRVVSTDKIFEDMTNASQSTNHTIPATTNSSEAQTISKTKFQLNKAIMSELGISPESHSEDSPISDPHHVYDVDITLSQPDFPGAEADIIEKEVHSISREQSRTEKSVSKTKTIVLKNEHVSDDFPAYDVEVTIPRPAESADLIEKESHTISMARTRMEKTISVAKVMTSKSEHPSDKPDTVFYDVEADIKHPDFMDYSGEISDAGRIKQIRVLNLNRDTPASSMRNIVREQTEAPLTGMEKPFETHSKQPTDTSTLQPYEDIHNSTEDALTQSPKNSLTISPNLSLQEDTAESKFPPKLSILNITEIQNVGSDETTTEETSVEEKFDATLEAEIGIPENPARTEVLETSSVFYETTTDSKSSYKSTDAMKSETDPNLQSEVFLMRYLPGQVSTPKLPVVYLGGRVRHQGAGNLNSEAKTKTVDSTKPAPRFIPMLFRKHENDSTTHANTLEVELGSSTVSSEEALFVDGSTSSIELLEMEGLLGVDESNLEVEDNLGLGSKSNTDEILHKKIEKKKSVTSGAYQAQAGGFTLLMVVILTKPYILDSPW